MPFGVEKIRRVFVAVAWNPKKDIQKDILIKEKYVLAAGHDFKNDHERDSIATAVYTSTEPTKTSLKVSSAQHWHGLTSMN